MQIIGPYIDFEIWKDVTFVCTILSIKMKPKMTRPRTKHVDHETNLSLFDKRMMDKSEDLKGKYMLLGEIEEKACLFARWVSGGIYVS